MSHRLMSDLPEQARPPVPALADRSRGLRLPFQGSTLVELLKQRAASQPGGLGYVFLRNGEIEDARWTWGELHQRSLAIAARLGASVSAGERALLLYPPGLEFIAAFFGCLQAGVIAVPVPLPQGTGNAAAMARLRAIAADASPAAVLTTAAVRTRWTADAGEICGPAESRTGRASMPGSLRCPWYATDDLQGVSGAVPGQPAASDVAFLQYTSGSTASPRGVMVSHANLVHNLSGAFLLSGDAAHNPSVSWLPATHDMGLIEGVLQPLYRGDTAYLMSPAAFLQRPLRWLAAISNYRAARSGGPNFAYDLAARRVTPEARAELDLSSWQVAYSGAEPIRHESLALFADAFAPCGFRAAAFRTAYGLAEATLLVSAGRWRPSGPGPVSCGRPAAGTTVLIVDPGTFRPCSEGRAGEIWIGGPGVAQGYWKRPDESARVFAARTVDGRGPFLRSGDLGCVIHGELYVTGRLKDLLIVRGAKHFPQDLEHTAEGAHVVVRRGCVAAVALGTGVDGDAIGILAEVEPRRLDEGLETADVTEVISTAICEAHGVRPGVVALLPAGSLPKTTSGKLQRFLCREGWLAGAFPVLARTAV